MIADSDLLVLSTADVAAVLNDQELTLMDVVRDVYVAHASGQTVVPHSSFLRFPERPSDRIIALPAYLGSGGVAGIKWIASFPENVAHGLDRASAVVILNAMATGRPYAVIEAALISAKRTAASAALATAHLLSDQPLRTIGLIGCGVISLETLSFIHASQPDLAEVVLFDTSEERARRLGSEWAERGHRHHIVVADSIDQVLAGADVVTLATTAAQPHIFDLSRCRPGAVVLHLSLRDIAPEALLELDNITDDVDHVCRQQTSLHLAEQAVGHRQFIRATIGDILVGRATARDRRDAIVIFSPFGLGALDLGVAAWAVARAREKGLGQLVSSFISKTGLPRVVPSERTMAPGGSRS